MIIQVVDGVTAGFGAPPDGDRHRLRRLRESILALDAGAQFSTSASARA